MEENGLISRNVTVNGRRTSLRLEREIWDAFDEICEREEMTRNQLCTQIDSKRHGSSRTSAVRAFIVTYFRMAAGNQGAENQGEWRAMRNARSA